MTYDRDKIRNDVERFQGICYSDTKKPFGKLRRSLIPQDKLVNFELDFESPIDFNFWNISKSPGQMPYNSL